MQSPVYADVREGVVGAHNLLDSLTGREIKSPVYAPREVLLLLTCTTSWREIKAFMTLERC